MRKNTKGESLVNVMVAFVVLLIILALFQRGVKLANNMVLKSQEIRTDTETLLGEYYLKQDISKDGKTKVTLTFTDHTDNTSFEDDISSYLFHATYGDIFYFGKGGDT